MGMNLANADKIVKDFFGPAVSSQISDAAPLLKWIKAKTDTETFGGRQWRQPIEYGRDEAVSAVAEDTSLPGENAAEAVGQSLYTEWLIKAAFMYGSTSFTGPSMAATKNSRESFVRVKVSEMNNLARNFAQRLNWWLNGDGNGAIAQVVSDAAGVLTLKAKTAVPIGGTRGTKTGMYVSLISSNLATNRVSGGSTVAIQQITAVNAATPSITLASDITDATANDYVVMSRSRNDEGATTVTNRVPMGLAGCVDDGTLQATFQGVSRSSFPQVQSTILANGGTQRALTKTLMQLAIDLPQEGEGDDTIRVIHCHQSARRAFVSLLNDDIRYVAEEARGGFADAKLSYNGGTRPIPIQVDRFARYGEMYFLDPDTFKILQLREMGWLDDGNGGIIRFVAGKDTYRAYYHWYFNLACFKPANNTVVRDLTYSFS